MTKQKFVDKIPDGAEITAYSVMFDHEEKTGHVMGADAPGHEVLIFASETIRKIAKMMDVPTKIFPKLLEFAGTLAKTTDVDDWEDDDDDDDE